MFRYAPVLWLVLWATVAGALSPVEQPVEGFARIISASRQAPYTSHRGTKVVSSYEYARDGTETVVWESAVVPEQYAKGFVTFVWVCGLARQEEIHELYLNDVKILGFSTGEITRSTTWEEGDFTLRFEPIIRDEHGEVHGVMYLHTPAAKAPAGKPVRLKVRGTKSESPWSWYMLHHFEDAYAKSAMLALPSGRRMVVAPVKSVFRSSAPIGWSCPLALMEGGDFPAEVIHLQARLSRDADERTLERQIRLEPDQQWVELALWSAGAVPEGDWEIALAFSGMDGVELLRWQGTIAVRNLTELDMEADWPYGSLTGSLLPALHAAGVDWSLEYLKGHLGSAFAFSMKKDGGRLWQASNYDRSISPRITSHLDHTMLDASRSAAYAVPPDHAETKAEAWETVRRAIDDGYPAVVRMKDTGYHPLPGPWSLIVGYNEAAETYTVHHAGYGKYTTRRDGFGPTDPVDWKHIMVFRPQTRPLDVIASGRRAIEHAIESSQGKHRGSDASAHGLAAWEMWLDAFQEGTVSVDAAPHHAAFLVDARQAAATYLRQIAPHFPPTASPPMITAAEGYEQVVADIAALRELCAGTDPDLQRGAQILSRALQAERSALASLAQVLEL